MPGTITSERIAIAALRHLDATSVRRRTPVPLGDHSPLTVVHVAGLRPVGVDGSIARPAHRSRWVAATPHEALDVVERVDADVVLVDAGRRGEDRRPVAVGLRVLESVRAHHPRVLRLAVIDRDDDLPAPLPTTVHQVIHRGRSADEIAAAMRAAAGLRHQVHDPVVRAAVATTERIGGADIRSIVASGTHPGIPAMGASVPGVAPSVLARHAGEVARCAALLARPEDAATARTAGFVHLLGVLFEAERQPDRLAAVNRRAHREGRRLVDVERELFGNSHVELAGHLLAHWGVDERVVDAVAGSHDAPSSWEPPFDAVDAVRVARLLAMTGRHALSMGPAHREPLPTALAGVAAWVRARAADRHEVAVGV